MLTYPTRACHPDGRSEVLVWWGSYRLDPAVPCLFGWNRLVVTVAVAADEDTSLGIATRPVRPGSVFRGESDRQLRPPERAIDANQRGLVGKPEAPGLAVVEQGSSRLGIFGRPQGVAGGAECDSTIVNPPVVEPGLFALAIVHDHKRLTIPFVIDHFDLSEQVKRIRAGAVLKNQPEDRVAGVQLAGPVRPRRVEEGVVDSGN